MLKCHLVHLIRVYSYPEICATLVCLVAVNMRHFGLLGGRHRSLKYNACISIHAPKSDSGSVLPCLCAIQPYLATL